MMKFGSVCSGIEAASVAFGTLGWKAQWFSEIEKFPCAVLAHHYPDVPNLGNMTEIHNDERFTRSDIDVLCGGTPCQSFSVAGLRKGLDDPRGNLALEFLRLAEIKKPKWILWENVPGVLSSGGGADIGAFLTALGQIGYGWAYRILDAQFIGVPQRRRRIFVVGYLGDWRPPAAVLFEPEVLCGDIETCTKKKTGVASLTATGVGTCGADDNQAQAGYIVVGPLMHNPHGGLTGQEINQGHIVMATGQGSAEVVTGKCRTLSCNHEAPIVYENHGQDSRIKEVSICPQINARAGTGGGNLPLGQGQVASCLRAEGFDASEDGTGRQNLVIAFDHRQDPIHGDIPGPLGAKDNGKAIAFTQNQAGDILTGNVVASMGTNSNASGRNTPKVFKSRVRRLTPKECERLQGFPDGYTRIPIKFYKTKRVTKNRPEDMWEKTEGGWNLMSSDSPRYKALGNSWAVPCARWIGARIQMMNDILNEIK